MGGMRASGGRTVEYLRLSVTDRCNLRCTYCMPEGGVDSLRADQLLTREEIVAAVGMLVDMGVRKVRLTGGEPLLRPELVGLVSDLARFGGLDELAMTTNGLLLDALARPLAGAGLGRVNLSLDTLRADRYRRLTRGGRLDRFWVGVRAAEEVGLGPIKINCVVMREVNDDEVTDLARLAFQHPWHVRFIEYMPMGEPEDRSVWHRHYLPWEAVRDLVTAQWHLEPVPRKRGGTAQAYRARGMLGTVGFIPAMSGHLCSECNRLRLSADGRLYLCLLKGSYVDLRRALRSGMPPTRMRSLIAHAVLRKPLKHGLDPHGDLVRDGDRRMSRLGG